MVTVTLTLGMACYMVCKKCALKADRIGGRNIVQNEMLIKLLYILNFIHEVMMHDVQIWLLNHTNKISRNPKI